MSRIHLVFAILAVVTFVGHLIANLFVDQVYWLPEYVWGASVVFSVLAIYAGGGQSKKGESNDRGFALASMVVGSLILLGLMYSGITWLFIGTDIGGVQM